MAKKPRPNSRKKRRERWRSAWREVEEKLDKTGRFSPTPLLHLQAACDLIAKRRSAAALLGLRS